MPERLAAVAALAAAAAVAAGAFGAHALAGSLDDRALELWQTAARYLALASVGALAIAAYRRGAHDERRATDGWLVLCGGVVFAASLFGLSLGAPRWFGAVTPLGGVGMISGFSLFGLARLRSDRR